MKHTATILSLLFCFSLSFSQTLNQLEVDDKGTEKLLGKVNREGIISNSFNSWYSENYDSYIPNKDLIETFKDALNQYDIKVFFGTWCGDSKRELPRFYKVLDLADFPENKLEVIAVDINAATYKQSPNGEEKGLNIHRVPTFIFYKNGKEVNRIVEYPVETLERDLNTIVTEKSYTPKYSVVPQLDKLMNEKTLETLRLDENKLVSLFADDVEGSWELNTYGYVLLRANNIEKALYVFDLNSKIFPYKYGTYNSLGKAYFEAKNYNLALLNYHKVLELNLEDKNAQLMIEKINIAAKK